MPISRKFSNQREHRLDRMHIRAEKLHPLHQQRKTKTILDNGVPIGEWGERSDDR